MYIDDAQYQKIVEETIIATVDIIFINQQSQILLWMRENEPLQWIYYIPWGRRIKNETVNSSVIRKAQEEVWIKIDPERLLFLWVYDDIFSKSKYQNIGTHCSSHTFVYKLNDKDIDAYIARAIASKCRSAGLSFPGCQ